MPSTGMLLCRALAEPGRPAPGGYATPRRRQLQNGWAYCSGSGRQSGPSFSIRGSRGNACARAIRSAASFRPGSAGRSAGDSLVNIKQLEHVLRASGSISGCREIVVIGSAGAGAYRFIGTTKNKRGQPPPGKPLRSARRKTASASDLFPCSRRAFPSFPYASA